MHLRDGLVSIERASSASPDAKRIATAKLVTTDAELEEACRLARAAGTVVVDTEFERTDTYFPRVALVQLATQDEVWLVDPLEIRDPSALRTLLDDEDIEKVLHACSEDIEVFSHWLGARVSRIFDTQLGAAFLGERFGIGYGELVQNVLGVEVDKKETRSNWLQRPLTEAQWRYACLDVIHLAEIHARMRAQLELLGRLEWVFEESAAIVAEVHARAETPLGWRAVKGAANLPPRGLAAASALANWRDRTARALDRPRNRVARDEHLVSLAESMPSSVEALRGAPLPHGLVKRWGAELQVLLDELREAPAEALPLPPGPPVARTQAPLLKRLRSTARGAAEELGVADELLSRKRLIEVWLEPGSGHVPVAWRGWRWQVAGERLQGMVREAGQGR